MAVNLVHFRRRAQSTIEFTILMSFMILMFSVFFAIASSRLVDLRNEKDLQIVMELKNVLDNEIKLAKTVEDGYYRKFYIPTNVEGNTYEIYIINNTEAVINFRGKEGFFRLPDKVVGNVSRGYNTITKSNDIIQLSSAG